MCEISSQFCFRAGLGAKIYAPGEKTSTQACGSTCHVHCKLGKLLLLVPDSFDRHAWMHGLAERAFTGPTTYACQDGCQYLRHVSCTANFDVLWHSLVAGHGNELPNQSSPAKSQVAAKNSSQGGPPSSRIHRGQIWQILLQSSNAKTSKSSQHNFLAKEI